MMRRRATRGMHHPRHEYFGVEFDTALLRRETLRNKYYGLLDTGIGLNANLMFKIDPELKTIVEAVIAKGNQLEKLMEKT